MRTPRPTTLMKLMLAAIVLIGGFGTSPTTGHAHGRPHDSHAGHHDDWAAHDHPHVHRAEGDEHDGDAVVDGLVFHLHGVWFGVPFSLPIQPGRDDDATPSDLLHHACPTPGLTEAPSQAAPRGKALSWLGLLVLSFPPQDDRLSAPD